jgi:rhamnosyltransferase subunit B
VLATLGSLGDLHPMIALALGLKSRGHQVALATTDFYRTKVESAGLTFRNLRPSVSPDDAQIIRQVMDLKKGPEYLIRTLLMPYLRDMYQDLLAATLDTDFLIAGEIVFAASLVAEKRRLPWAAAILAPFSLFSAYDPSVLPLLPFSEVLTAAPAWVQRCLLRAGKARIHNWGTPITHLRRELGLSASAHPLYEDRFSPRLNLAMFADVLGSPQQDWPTNTIQTGFAYYETPQETQGVNTQIDDFLLAEPRPIVFTLGSAAVLHAERFFDESAMAADLLGVRALLVMGKNSAPADHSSMLMCVDYAAYSRIFPQSLCVVHQGGVGTTAQALRAGTPQLVMPYAFDQPDNAARITRIGVGMSIRKDRYKAVRVADRLRDLLADPAYRIKARDVSRRLASQAGVERACGAIESVLLTN